MVNINPPQVAHASELEALVPMPRTDRRLRRGTQGHVLLLFQPVIGGVPHYVSNLAEGLIEQGWQVSVAAPSTTPVLARLSDIARHVIAVDTTVGLSPRDLRVFRQLARLCKRARIDLIHAHSSKAGAIAAVVGRITGVPSVYSPHGWSFQRELSFAAERAYVTAERILARGHAHVIAVADVERADAERCRVVDPGRLELVYTGLHDSTLPARARARAELGLGADEFVIAWVGRIGTQKRSEQLPALARELREDARLLVLGYDLPESEIGRELAQRGAVVSSSLAPETVYAASDALAVTSRWEGFPLVVLEAMRAGLPVVGYDIGGLREQVEDGATGYLVDSGDVRALARQLRTLAWDTERARRMGLAGRRRFRERFNYAQMISKIDLAYQRVLAPRG
jgi:glycosyltransferase involved in cell wall biosynthesis